jgi:hypothetical protein
LQGDGAIAVRRRGGYVTIETTEGQGWLVLLLFFVTFK